MYISRKQLLIVIVLTLISVEFAHAQTGLFRRLVEVQLRARDFGDFCDLLVLDEDQRAVASTAYMRYQDSIRDLDKEMNAKVIILLGASSVQEAGTILTNLNYGEHAKFTLGLLKVVQGSRNKSKQAISTLLLTIKASLNNDQAVIWEDAVLALRRDLYLSPKIDPLGPNSAVDFGLNVDLCDLIDEAMLPNGELYYLIVSVEEEAIDNPELIQARELAKLAIEEYKTRLDVVLQSNANSILDTGQELRAAAMRGDVNAARRSHRKKYDYRKRLLDLNYATTETLAGLLATLDMQDQASAFKHRVDLKHFPDTMLPTSVDRMYEWLQQNATLGGNETEQLEFTYESFVQSRDLIRTNLKRLVLKMHKEVSAYVSGSNKNDVFDDLDDAHEKMKKREELTHASIRALLPPDVVENYNIALEKARRYTGQFFDTQGFLRRGSGIAQEVNKRKTRDKNND